MVSVALHLCVRLLYALTAKICKKIKKKKRTILRLTHAMHLGVGWKMFVFLFDKIINKTGGFVLSFSFQLSRSHR